MKKPKQLTDADIAQMAGLGETTLEMQEQAQAKLIKTMGEAKPATAEEVADALFAVYSDESYITGKLAGPADRYFAGQLGLPLRRNRHSKEYALFAQDTGELSEGQKKLSVALKGKLDAEGRDKFTTLGSTLWFNKVCALARTASERLTIERASAQGNDLVAMRKALALNIPRGTDKAVKRAAFEALEAPYKVSVSFEAAKAFVAGLEPKPKSRREEAREALPKGALSEVDNILAQLRGK